MAEQKGRTKMGEEKAGGAARGCSEALLTLKDARTRLVRVGWTQGSEGYGNPEKPQCAQGWISLASADSMGATYRKACRFLLDALGGAEITSWNDAKGRTQAEVLAAFDRAIEMASTASAPKEPPDPPEGPEAQRG